MLSPYSRVCVCFFLPCFVSSVNLNEYLNLQKPLKGLIRVYVTIFVE